MLKQKINLDLKTSSENNKNSSCKRQMAIKPKNSQILKFKIESNRNTFSREYIRIRIYRSKCR